MAKGYSTQGDILRTAVDGTSLADIFREQQETIRLRNEARDTIDGILSFRTTAVGEHLLQGGTPEEMQESSEFGLPTSIRTDAAVATLGYGFKFFDLASRYTFKFLAGADPSQIAATHDTALEADSRLLHRAVFGALFNNSERVNEEGLIVKPLFNGDGFVPAPFNGVTFDGSTTQYVVSGAATLDGGDLRDAYRLVARHGFGDPAVGGRILILLNPLDAEPVRGFRKGTAATDPYDFIPSQGSDAYLTSEQIVGDVAPAQFGRVRLFGSYGPAWLSENALIPAGYVLAVATYGPNDQRNPVALREHVRPELRGFRQIPGPDNDYPLQGSIYSRGVGSGVRKRGAGAVVQIKATGAYTPPAEYSTVVA